MPRNHPDIDAATAAQIRAADPEGSRLAAANAGSGKTKVLVDRVTRLLLGGTPPDKILCLTYTKAAANEMQNRLFKTLGEWCVMPEDDLKDKLNELFGSTKPRQKDFIEHARRLFAKALETPEGLKVQTIHAFCERILGRFPIEAGIQPGFEPIDDADMRDLRHRIETEIFREAYKYPDGTLAHAVRILAAERADQTVEKLMTWASGHVDDIKSWQKKGVDPLKKFLGLGNDTSVRNIKAMAWDSTDKVRLGQAAKAMLSSSVTDQRYGEKILAALEIDDPAKAFDQYASGLMTGGGLRKRPVTNNGPEIAREFWGIQNALSDESLRVLKVFNLAKTAKVFNLTQAIYDMSASYVDGYEKEKRRLRGLDFNDQIALVRDLLGKSEYAAWVLYKLDYGVHHILVDEAQDTAPSQWSIIDSIRDGFDVADPSELAKEVKTFFAVGDEKQSIYSFQGARPEQFMERIRDARDNDAESVRMEMSFRSAPEILQMVDAVFRDNGAQQRMFDPGVWKTITEQINHLAGREDTGLVELWPLAPRPEGQDEKEPWDTRPVDAASKGSAREQLAAAIADQIRTWLDDEELVYDRALKSTRPMRADDILILVRGRNDFFEGVIRNLKARDIPVAGADRLIISEAIVVQDMLALTRFVLLPSDDLSLAEVLKGPLFGFTDDDLLELCFGREGTVWTALWQSPDPKCENAAMRLDEIIRYSRIFAPFEFYRRVLDMTDKDGQSHLKAIYKRLSLEVQDALEAFLNKALAHQRQGAPSLQHFLEKMSADKQDIKREMDNAQGEVRVMTVHGAKGLEAPVVILPDTTQIPASRNSEQLLQSEHGLVYLPSSSSVPEVLKNVLEAEKQRQMQEYLRLLYVAMTRAESRLLICGYWFARLTNGMQEGSWYEELSGAFNTLKCETKPHQNEDWGEIKIFGGLPKPATNLESTEKEDYENPPDWAYEMAATEKQTVRRVTPSHLLASGKYVEPPVRSPLQAKGVDRFLRGNLTHKLLEILPEVGIPKRRQAAEKFLAQHSDISDKMKTSIEDEVMAVLEHSDYRHFFGPGSRAEVDLAGQGAGLPKHLRLNAQIDRLAVTEDTVYIIDYKSNRPPPKDIADVPEIYWGQMAAYREMIKLTHPSHKIVCALLWTDGPDLMILPEDGLDAALTQISALPT